MLVAVACESRSVSHLLRLAAGSGKVLTDMRFPAIQNKFRIPPLPEAKFSGDGSLVALREDDGNRLTVADTNSGKTAFSSQHVVDRFYSMAFRHDGRVLAIGDFAGRVRLLDSKSGKLLQKHSFETEMVWRLDFSPDGKTVVAYVSHSGPARVTLFDAETGAVRWNHEVIGTARLRFTADGREILFLKGRWHRLDSATGKPVGNAMGAEYGHDVAMRPDGKVLALGGYHGHISQWDLVTHKRIDDASADPPGQVSDLRFNSDGSKLSGFARGWYEWDVKTGKQSRLTRPLDVGPSEQIAVSHDQCWLARIGRTSRP